MRRKIKSEAKKIGQENISEPKEKPKILKTLRSEKKKIKVEKNKSEAKKPKVEGEKKNM